MSQSQTCSVCTETFEVFFSYQVETSAEGAPSSYFCSQRCLEASHSGRSGETLCDGCGVSFTVELALQVVFNQGRRTYACSPACRARVLGRPAALSVVPQSPEPAASAAASVATDIELARNLRTDGGAYVLSVFNHKGGTGKTTTSVTLAAALAARGNRVLLVDTDGQGNVAVSLGLTVERSLYHVLVMGLAIEQAVIAARPGLDVLASNETLAAAELYLAGRKQRDRVLAARLNAARDRYDYIIVDCSPSLSLLNQNALAFADAVLCPVACDYLSLVGVRQVLRTLKHVNKLLGHPVKLWGVLPTFFDSRARICHEALTALREHFGDRCLQPVRLAIKVKEAPAQGRTLLEYAPGSNAARDYEVVVDRLIAETPGTQTAELSLAQAGGAL